MDPVEIWNSEIRTTANQLAIDARQLRSAAAGVGAVSAGAASELATLQAAGQELLATVMGGLSLLPDCDAFAVAAALGETATGVEPKTAERLAPIVAGSNLLATLTGQSGGGPVVWAQERDGLPGVLEKVPLPERYRRTVDNVLWTRDMFESSTRALEGVGEEIENQDGEGARKAAAAAREIEEKAANPPAKPGLLQKIGTAIVNFFETIFG